MKKNKIRILFKSACIFVLITLFVRFGFVEIAVWNESFREKVFLNYAPNEYRYFLVRRLLSAENIELYDEISEVYLSIVDYYEKNHVERESEENIRTFISSFKCYETLNWRDDDFNASKNSYFKVLRIIL